MLAFALLLWSAPPSPHRRATAIVERAEMCLHWAGEEAYDRDRARQIDAGLKAAGCDTIQREAPRFLQSRPPAADARAVRKAMRDLW